MTIVWNEQGFASVALSEITMDSTSAQPEENTSAVSMDEKEKELQDALNNVAAEPEATDGDALVGTEGETLDVTEGIDGTEGEAVDTTEGAEGEAVDGSEGDAVDNSAEMPVDGDMSIMPAEGDMMGDYVDGGMGDMMEETTTSSGGSVMASWPFVIGISTATLALSIVIGILLAKKRIKKGFDLYED